MSKPIAISLSPNTQTQDIFLALKLLFSPWRYVWGGGTKVLEQWFRQYFGASYAVSFASGRCALIAILKAMEVKEEDEVILQSFTCVAVPNAILRTGAKPVYADITKSLTIDPYDIEKKITKNTKAIIVQHTFGIPTHLSEVLAIARKKKLYVIEDCAHVIGASYKHKKLGMFADAAFFSFGRDKAFSSVFGGMAITKKEILGKKIRAFQKSLPNPTFLWTAQQLLHPVAFSLILPLYDVFSIGKALLVLLQKLHFLSFPVALEEKSGKTSVALLRRMPNALALLTLSQLKRVHHFNQKREHYSNVYIQELKKIPVNMPYTHTIPFLRFPLLLEKRDEALALFKKHNIYLGTWYKDVIDPKGVDLKKVFYDRGSCPKAEQAAKKIINLPTYPNMSSEQAKVVAKLLKQYVTNSGN